MNRIYYIYSIVVCIIALVSCASDDSILDSEFEESGMTATVPDKILYVDEEGQKTRSTLYFDKTNMVMKFGWKSDDQVGVFNVSCSADESENKLFTYRAGFDKINATTATSRFVNYSFSFDRDNFWTAYSPYLLMQPDGTKKKPLDRESLVITYRGQKAKDNGTPGGIAPSKNPKYTQDSETLASSHLADYDCLISTPSQPDEGQSITDFKMSHVGATMRLYMQFPEGAFGGAGKYGKIKSIKVVTKNGNYITSDALLKINPYGSDTSYSVDKQITTNNIELTFDNAENSITVPDHGYAITYMEFFPTKIPAETAFLHITVDVDGVERYFKSKALAAVNIKAGYIYQWTATKYDDIIELTATLQSWQDIVAGLSTDLEK